MFIREPRLDQTPRQRQPQHALPRRFELEAMGAETLTADFTLPCHRAPADEERPDWVLQELKRHGLSRTRAGNSKKNAQIALPFEHHNAKLTGRTEPACRWSGLQRGVKFAKQMPRCKLSG